MIATSAASAEDVELGLCTASAAGIYYAAGQEIARQVDRTDIRVDVVETNGSMDNLERMAMGECDAAIVQVDAYLVYQDTHRHDRLNIKRPHHLYDEFVHLVCNRTSGVESIENLLVEGAVGALLIGSETSGGANTWASITLLNSSYAKLTTVNTGGMEALDQVSSGTDASCMMYVSGLGSEYSSNVNRSGDRLRLITIDDRSLDDATFAGSPIYSFQTIPPETYPLLQEGKGEVETLTVRAIFVVSGDWAESYPSAYEMLTDCLQRDVPEIRQLTSAN